MNVPFKGLLLLGRVWMALCNIPFILTLKVYKWKFKDGESPEAKAWASKYLGKYLNIDPYAHNVIVKMRYLLPLLTLLQIPEHKSNFRQQLALRVANKLDVMEQCRLVDSYVEREDHGQAVVDALIEFGDITERKLEWLRNDVELNERFNAITKQ